MAVETLAAFRAANQGMNVKPVVLAVKGTDGEMYIVEVDPVTGAIPVSATIDPTGLATESGQTATNDKLDTVIGHVDGLETAVASTNTKLDAIAGYVDGIETLVGSTNTKLDTLHTDIATTIGGYVDGIETLVGSTNTKLDTLHTDIATTIAGYVDGIEGALTTLNAKDFATEATLAKLKKWPYATHNTITPTSDVNNEYYTYKNSGGTTVGVITKAKATGVITYSPDKAY